MIRNSSFQNKRQCIDIFIQKLKKLLKTQYLQRFRGKLKFYYFYKISIFIFHFSLIIFLQNHAHKFINYIDKNDS